MKEQEMKNPKPNKKRRGSNEIDWIITLLPLIIVTGIAALLLTFPQQSMKTIDTLWSIFVNKLGFFYILLGSGLVCTAFYLAFSKYGAIRLGSLEKPRYSNFAWGAMIFTSTMAADILYWSLIEWGYYYAASPFGQRALTIAERQDWAATYPLFHWGITPWSFHIVCAVAFGYMLHVRQRKKQKLSEACRPLFGNKIDGVLGTVIDVFSVVGLLAGTATTFSLATPLLSLAISTISGIPESRELTLVVLCIIAAVYTSAVLLGIKGISHLAKISVVCFSSLILFVFLLSPKLYIIETSITGIGKMLQNFISLSTWMDPLRISGTNGNGAGFPQQWTIFYWAYWIAWFVATPFFIGTISEGRTVRNTVLGGLICGISGTYCSFIVLGNYGLYLETHRLLPAAERLAAGIAPAEIILSILETLPLAKVVLVLLIITMIALYASTFDAITMVIASYSQRQLEGREPKKSLRAFWSLVFILLPAALILTGSNLSQLQSLSVIAAFPLGIIMICIVVSFLKDAKNG
ncbi:betaine/carnitine/choline transporter (BCCT) family transporter [Treponema vincentii F0403]|uniref:Betaine/carnitine/choline transporter (BCCT) family transporter n=2 Tax=Treponema vincentii TaxID=69710 RepID=S3LR48_9SPIR|nr:BCCT family transporter [Treponema vincentii]EPF46827.1 betaine/carnitine/choline transporter (BCCT) family transporter [Treponema vincentii F0403]